MSNATLVNFVAGETSPKSRGRFDIPSYPASCRKLLNFIVEITGAARFRTGFRHRAETRDGKIARLVPFQLNDSQAFMLEFSNAKFRVYKDDVLVTSPRTTITAITQADPAVITVADPGALFDDQEIIMTNIEGMEELNGRQVKLANKSGSTFELVDPTTGVDIDSTGFGAYVSDGDVGLIVDYPSPYLEVDLVDIQHTPPRQNLMYMTHPRHPPQKLVVDSAESWIIAPYARVSDPFVSTFPVLTIVNVILGTDTFVEFPVGSSVSFGSIYTIDGIVGTVELNTKKFRFVSAGIFIPVPPFNVRVKLEEVTGGSVDSTSFTAYISDGTATPDPDNPIAPAFYEGRLGFFGTDQRPDTFFLSRSPDPLTGATRYDDFTGGTDADNAAFFTLAPASGQVDFIAWALATANRLLIGTFGGPFRVSGGGVETPITPTSINVRQIDTYGCEATMATLRERVFYIQRGGGTLRVIQFSDTIDDFESRDMLLNAEQIAESGLRRIVSQTGRPDLLWAFRKDGIAAGMTIEKNENITGWHRHKIGGTDPKIIDLAVLGRPDKNDQLWAITERTVGGVTRRSTEILADDVSYLDIEDFFTIPTAEAADKARFENSLYRRQERYIHMDAARTFNGSDRGLAAGATVTPGALTGTSIAFTASAAVFKASDVGNQIWKKPDPDTGIGAGRAEITAVNGPGTIATCDILVDFDAVTAVAAGEWHLTAKIIRGLWHLEGQKVSLVTDGAVISDGRGILADFPVVLVVNGAITLTEEAAVVHVGLPYEGVLQTQNLEMGGRSGPAQAKPRNIVEMFIRFLGTLGVRFGTSLYNLDKIYHRPNQTKTDRPSPIFSGIRKLPHEDSWSAEKEKFVIISQRLPLPCVVQFIDMRFDTGDNE